MGAAVSEPKTPLSQALAAYASATPGEALDTDLVRAKVLRSVRAPSRRSLRRYSLALPLAATLAASAAFAASQPAVRAAVTARLETLLGSAPTPQHARSAARKAEPTRMPSAATGPALPDAAETPVAPIAIDQLPLALPALSAGLDAAPTAGVAPAQSSETSPTNSADPQLEAYRAAHRTHFDSASPSAALAAWDRYLDDFPAGSFATDARFNRALCLIRLGRQAEARAALTPFANAAAGSYRQAEAAALLHGLPAPKSRATY